MNPEQCYELLEVMTMVLGLRQLLAGDSCLPGTESRTQSSLSVLFD